MEDSVRKHRILVVDDESGIVNAVRRELSTPPFGRHRYEVEGFTSPLQALERAKVQEFDAVLSDYRMPEMNGLDFIKALVRIQPDCTRIVLSGQTDLEALIRMINETHIYRFIPKPWNNYFLKSSLAQAIDFREASTDNARLAGILRDHGIEQPRAWLNTVDQILVVDEDLNAAHAVARCLTRRSPLDEVLRAVRADAGHGRAPAIDPAQVSVQVTDSAAYALKMAGDVAFSCLIADCLAPRMGGTQFLASFLEKQPDAACIIVSGAADMESLVVALDLARLHSYIGKPWADFELRTAVALALTRRRLMLENRVLAQICKTRNLDVVE